LGNDTDGFLYEIKSAFEAVIEVQHRVLIPLRPQVHKHIIKRETEVVHPAMYT